MRSHTEPNRFLGISFLHSSRVCLVCLFFVLFHLIAALCVCRCVSVFLCASLEKPLELLCEKAIGTGNRPMGAGEALRRVLECLAFGILMAGKPRHLYRENRGSQELSGNQSLTVLLRSFISLLTFVFQTARASVTRVRKS